MNMIRTTISLPLDVHEALREEAFRTKKTIGAIIADKLKKRSGKTTKQLLAELEELAEENARQNPGVSFSDKVIEMRYEQ